MRTLWQIDSDIDKLRARLGVEGQNDTETRAGIDQLLDERLRVMDQTNLRPGFVNGVQL